MTAQTSAKTINPQPQALLERAADIMETGWCSEVRAKDRENNITQATSEDAAQWCALGALELAFHECRPETTPESNTPEDNTPRNMDGTDSYRACMNALSQALPDTERFPGYYAWQQASAVVSFNNRQEEGAPVVAIFRKAARNSAQNRD